MTDDWIVPCVVIRVVDGDSVWVDADLGWHLSMRMLVRVAHIDAPETSTDAGKAARDYARALLPPGMRLTLTSHRLDKYGRSLATLTSPGTFPYGGSDFAAEMLSAGLANPYEGGPR